MVCFDESPKQLIAEVHEPIPVQPGAPAKYDVDYQRKGVRDIMMICEPKRGFREVLITERRTKKEFAHCMDHIVEPYPDAQKIIAVLDNLNTPPLHQHTKARTCSGLFHARALPEWTDYYSDLTQLSEIDWDLLQRRDFKRNADDPRKMERYQAEALIHQNLPVQGILGIVCYPDALKQSIEQEIQMRNLTLPVYARTGWYF